MANAKNLGYLIPAVVNPAGSHCVRVAVPDDDQHRAAFWGALQTLTQWHNWERDPTKSGKDVAAVWAGVIASAHENYVEGLCEMDCDCIKDLSFDPVTGILSYTNELNETVNIFNTTDTYVSSQYTVITANEADADDFYCYAAWLLAERAADDLQDMLEAIDVLEDATVSVVSEIFASMVDLVPFFGDLAEAYIRITDNLAEEAYDWVRLNARDIEARALAAEIFYCGIKRAMENGGQDELRNGIIQAAGANLKQFVLTYIDDLWEIPDLWDVFEDAYNALDGELIGYAVVAWFLVTDVALDALGADRPIEAIIAHATKHAAAHDSRDCAGFDCVGWCHLFDFEEMDDPLGWTAYQGGVFNNGAWRSTFDAFDTKLAIYINIPITPITSVRVKYTTADDSGGHPRVVKTNVTRIYGDPLETGTGEFNQIMFEDHTANTDVRVQIQSQGKVGENTITQIEVCGTGSNPFD